MRMLESLGVKIRFGKGKLLKLKEAEIRNRTDPQSAYLRKT